MGQVVISTIGKNNCLERRCYNWVSFPPPQLASFSTKVLNELENDAGQEKTWETIEYSPVKQLSKIALLGCICPTRHCVHHPSKG